MPNAQVLRGSNAQSFLLPTRSPRENRLVFRVTRAALFARRLRELQRSRLCVPRRVVASASPPETGGLSAALSRASVRRNCRPEFGDRCLACGTRRDTRVTCRDSPHTATSRSRPRRPNSHNQLVVPIEVHHCLVVPLLFTRHLEPTLRDRAVVAIDDESAHVE